tara:strand:- start:6171 stop:6572 length:402 start_codon:yes stop_codon:yes gene_type:complete
MQSERINDLLKSEDKTNQEIALKILKQQITKANCIAIVYQVKQVGHKFKDSESIQNSVADVMEAVYKVSNIKINRSISKSTKDIYNYLRNNDVDDESINAFLKYYTEFVKYSITLDTSFDYIPPANLNLFDND